MLYDDDYNDCYFLVVRDYVNIRGEKIEKIISFIAKHSFSVYMLHIIVLTGILPSFMDKMKTGWDIIIYGMLGYMCICIVTIILAVLMDLIFINPLIQFMIKKTK